ncbi:3-oxoacyl-ACP synthase III family protein [Pseudonocardia sp. GCM10023141]|uniref:3-oxoacyl-ACP synthase III family protein n=1 Tax=Pseudonocardia sp. GCM10023141 TaxID=3252653 RepID=UPI003614405D
MLSVGIRSIAVEFPSVVRTNDYWRARYPDVLADAEQKTLAQVFNPTDPTAASADFDTEMRPYLADVFRGTVERRALGPGETTLLLEERAARKALDAAGLAPADVDLMICCSFLPEHLGLGDAAFLAQRLGLTGSAWNVESTCSGALVALQTASALVRAGEYRTVLVVVSCTYSRVMDETDTLSWFLGDGAGAYVVGEVPAGQGLLAVNSVHTGETCGAFRWDLDVHEGAPRIAVRAGTNSGRALRDTSSPVLRHCCLGAVEKAGLAISDIDFLVCNTPLAWYDRFAARALRIDPARTLTTYPRYANIGPALTTTNLYEAASTGMIKEGSLVLLFTVGTVSTAGAAVMRWGDVGLGPAPAVLAQPDP